jgi:hypothetical protein
VSAQAYTELGLALDIAGAILLYFFGLPQAVLVDRENWVEERYPWLARFCKYAGLPLLILGFICQWIGARLG